MKENSLCLVERGAANVSEGLAVWDAKTARRSQRRAHS